MRTAILLLFFFSMTVSAKAQNADVDIKAMDDIYKKLHAENDHPNEKSVGILNAELQKAATYIANIERTGSYNQKNISVFIQALLKYEAGMVYKQTSQPATAYKYFKEAETLMELCKNFSFPLEYIYNGYRNTYTRTSYEDQYHQFLGSLAGVCVSLSKYDDAKKYISTTLAYPNGSPYFRYQQSALWWSAQKQQGQADSEYVAAALQAMKYWSRLDTAKKRWANEGRYYRGATYLQTFRDIIPRATDLKNKAAAYLSAAYYPDSLHEDRDAAELYGYAINSDSSLRSVLWQVNNFAKRTGNAALFAATTRNLERSYANETDEAVKNLGATLQQIIPNASDPKRYFSDIRGKSFKVSHIGGKNYRSAVELNGALVTYISEFLNNGLANYFYWNAIIEDEPKANLQGKLRARYNALCAETRNIFPNAPVVYKYDNINYFEMEVNQYATIQIDYFYSEGYKDRLMYTVVSKMPK